MLKIYNGIEYQYDPKTNKYLNPTTNKWVIKPRQSVKGKAKGKSIKIIETKEFRFIIFNQFTNFDPVINQRINYFLSHLYQKYNILKCRYGNSRNSVYYNSITLKYILGENYINLINYLIENSFIEKNYSKQNRYGYTLNFFKPVFFPSTITYHYVDIYKIQKSITSLYQLNEKRLGILKPIAEQMFDIKIKIDEDTFIQLIKEQYYTKKRDGSLEQYIETELFLLDRIHNWNSANRLEKYGFFTVDEHGGRLHSIFTELPKKIRNHILKTQGYDCSIDMTAAQPTLLADHVNDSYSGLFKERFVNDVINNDIYLIIKDIFKLKSRDDAKNKFYKIIFSSLKKDADCWESVLKFNEIYPCTGYIIKELRHDDWNCNIVSKLLQNREVDIFKQIWCKLKENNIKFITIHDEIIFNCQDIEVVECIFRSVMDRELSIPYKLKIKNL